MAGANGTSLVFLGLVKGTYTIQAEVVDATGAHMTSPTVVLTVTPATGQTTPQAASGVSTLDIVQYLVIGLLVGGMAVFLLQMLLRRPGGPPPSRGTPPR
jgi:hypothetical protein